MPQTLAEIRSLLAAIDRRPKHRLGQNFLHDHNKLNQIIEAADVQPNDTILEVGPGTGALTEQLLQIGASVIAVEIDPDLCQILRNQFGLDTNRWRLIHADVMANKHTLDPSVVEALQSVAQFSLIANLPYQIASPLLLTLACDHLALTRATVMVQREVADRITAPPADPGQNRSGKDYGPLSVMLQSMFNVQRIMTLPPGCFWPPPKVDSAVVQLTRHPKPLTHEPQKLRALVHLLFTRRRKQIGTILGRDAQLPPGVTPAMRPEQLTIQQLIAIQQSNVE